MVSIDIFTEDLLRQSGNYTAAAGDKDTQIRGRVMTSDPAFSVEANSKISVKCMYSFYI